MRIQIPVRSIVAAALIAPALFRASPSASEPPAFPPVLADLAAEAPPEPPTPRDTIPAAEWSRRWSISPVLARTIQSAALEHGLEPALVFGLIAQESRFDPRAIGRHGEHGLMQVKPSLARHYDPRVTPEALLDPEVNLRIGLTHLAREVAHFGDRSLGLLSYNMGRSRVSRALAHGAPPRNRYAARVLALCGDPCA